MTTEVKFHTKEEAIKAVTQNGYELKFCSPELQDDEDVVMTAIKQYGWVFGYASTKLKSNKPFILKAIHEVVYPHGLVENANITIQSDIEVITLSLEKSEHGFEFSSTQGEAALNKELAAKALVKWGNYHGSMDSYLWNCLEPTIQEFFPSNSFYEKAQAYLIQLEQEQQAEVVSGGSTTEDSVVW